MKVDRRLVKVTLAVALAFVCATASRADEPAAAPSPGRNTAIEGLCGVAEPILVKDVPSPDKTLAGQLVIQATWDPTIAAQAGWQAVIQQAINEWQNVLIDNGCSRNPLPIYFRAVPLGGFLGFTQSLVYNVSGCMFADTVGIDPAFTWFVDPTPANDSEFTSGTPPAGFDLLSVARHELGHAVGWGFNLPVNNLLSGQVFDSGRLNILTGGGTGLHTDSTWARNGLMNPATDQKVRRAIALYPDASLVARSYGGSIPMAFVDPTNPNTGVGTANDPWRSLTDANAFAPATWPLLLSTGSTHHVPTSYVTSSVRRWDAARGGSSVVAP